MVWIISWVLVWGSMLVWLFFSDFILRLLIKLNLKYAWKVVTIVDKKYMSCIVSGHYALEYPKGKEVKAKDNTLGIMCFLTKRKAKKFMSLIYNSKIKRIKPIKDFGYIPKIIAIIPLILGYEDKNDIHSKWNYILKEFYKGRIIYNNLFVPKGTVCYKKIKVID